MAYGSIFISGLRLLDPTLYVSAFALIPSVVHYCVLYVMGKYVFVCAEWYKNADTQHTRQFLTGAFKEKAD